MEHLDDTIKTREDAERYLSLPSLGLVPSFPGSDRRFLKRVADIGRRAPHQHANGAGGSVNGDGFYPYAPDDKRGVSFESLGVVSEAYRTLRTGILLSQAELPPKRFSLPALFTGKEIRYGGQ